MSNIFYDSARAAMPSAFPTLDGGFNPAGGAGYDVPSSGLDAATKARLAQARAADAAAVEAARTATAARGVAPAAAKPAGLGARAAGAVGSAARSLNPAITAGGLARGAGPLARISLALAPLMGLISAGADSKETVHDFGDTIGMDTSTFGGRLGANAVNFLRRTGDAATFGGATRLGRVLTGGSFFDEDKPAAAVAAPTQATAAVGVPVEPQQATNGDVNNPLAQSIATAMNFQPPAAPRDEVIARGPVESSGGYVEGPNGRIELPSGTVQRFGVRRPRLADNIDYAIERNAARADQNARVESGKLGVALLGAGKRSAEEHIALGKLSAAQAWLKDNPGDYGGYAAILAGKDPKEAVGTIAGATGNTSVVTRNGRAITMDANGNAVERAIYRQPTTAEIDTMLKNKDSAAHKASFQAHFGPEAYKTFIEKK